MDDQKYDSAVNYCGKWCLYQPTPSSSVICIFIIEKKDIFLKFVYERTPNDIEYREESYFKNCVLFTISPFENSKPSIVNDDSSKTKVTTYSYGHTNDENCSKMKIFECRYGRTEENYRDCYHLKNGYCRCCILTSDPPQYEACSFRNDLPRYEYCDKV